ncbi:MAG: segregation/condensation protein A [Patescibacteria group bacterium]|nr:segregation/condensation protein A [Patescibacteria group bacterium]MCL5224195.1 segregation/condensation protein A [Patescibacteria group bacterium]
MSDYELKLPEFQGPIDKLLELIEAKQLEINRVSLAEVTADFIQYLETIKNVSASTLADFISVAAKLILIKSHTLLPSLPVTAEEESEMAELEHRLAIYRELRNAERNIHKIWGKNVALNREFLANVPEGFYLSQPLQPNELLAVMNKLNQEVTTFLPQEASEKVKIVSLEETIRGLAATINKVMSTSFDRLTKGKDKKEIVVLFLALLHLLKDNIIQVDQPGIFESINIVFQNNAKQS